jgi:tRNA(fMet)-specific endonuclease VapC
MRTTIELKDESRAKLLAIAARRGEKGFSRLIDEAVEQYVPARRGGRRRTATRGPCAARVPQDPRFGSAARVSQRAAGVVAMSIIADTDVLIDFLAGCEPAASRVALELETGALRTTAVTRFELLAGAKTSRQAGAVRRLLDAVPALPLDSDAADRAADVRRALERQGTPIGMGDSLISGIALATGATLLTRNLKHFERVEGLRLSGRHPQD